MRAMKVTWLTVALLAFGCQAQQGAPDQQPDEVQQLGEPGMQEPGMGGQAGEQPMGEEMGQPGDMQQPGMEGQQPGMEGQQPGQQPGDQMQRQPMGGAGDLGQAQPGQQMGQQGQQMAASGTVQNVDMGEGTVTLQTQEGEELDLHARPMDLGQVVQGDQIQVQYQQYGNTNWVVPSPNAEQNLAAYGTPQTLTGTVENMDMNQGTLTINGQEIMVHPSMLQQVQQNQNVRIEYVTVEGTNWATTVEPASGTLEGT